MVKTIYLLRHAKSDHSDGSLTDKQRPLNERGKRDSLLMGKAIPNLINSNTTWVGSSTSVRTRQTLSPLYGSWIRENDIHWKDDLYAFSSGNYHDTLKSIPEEYDQCLICGHNPSIEEFIEELTGATCRIGTSFLICIESYAGSWKNITYDSGTLRWILSPKVLHALS